MASTGNSIVVSELTRSAALPIRYADAGVARGGRAAADALR